MTDVNLIIRKTLIMDSPKILPTSTTPRRNWELKDFESSNQRVFWYSRAFSLYKNSPKGMFDLGPPGVSLKNNIIALWRKHFVIHDNMLEVECPIVTPKCVLQASGHVKRFTDLLIIDKYEQRPHRADKILEGRMKKLIAECDESDPKISEYMNILALADTFKKPEKMQEILIKYNVAPPRPTKFNTKEWNEHLKNNSNHFSLPVPFNLMFETSIGPVKTANSVGFLRPETAQGIFVLFNKLLKVAPGNKVPFSVAQIGKSYRNEIAPKNGLIRTREFSQAEIEHFIHPTETDHPRYKSIENISLNVYPRSMQGTSDGSSTSSCLSYQSTTIKQAITSKLIGNQTMAYFIARTQLFLLKLGLHPSKIRFRQHLENEMSHYAIDCWDAEVELIYGWVEIVGIADRSCYDLKAHSKTSGKLLQVSRSLNPQIINTFLQAIPVMSKIGKTFRAIPGASAAIKVWMKDLSEIDCKKFQANIIGDTKSHSIILTTVGRVKKGKPIPIHQDSLIEFTPEMVKFVIKQEKISVEKFYPRVIEPSFGIQRLLYCTLDHAFKIRKRGENSNPDRILMSLPPCIAPYHCSVLPLSSSSGVGGQKSLTEIARELFDTLSELGIRAILDTSSNSIGRSYARTDEIGIPFGCTIDFDTIKDQTITLRERDSTNQVRLPMKDAAGVIFDLINGRSLWKNIKYPSFDN